MKTEYQKTIEATIKQIDRTPGLFTAIHEHYCKLTGSKVSRQRISNWLSPSPKLRRVANAINGENLLKAIKRAQQDFDDLDD